jgi:hypothetical protein
LVFLDFLFCYFQLIEEERRGKSIEFPESSFEDDDVEDTSNAEEESGEHSSDSSSSGSDADESSEREETSPKVDITG